MRVVQRQSFSSSYLKGIRAYVASDKRTLRHSILRTENPIERKLLGVRLLLENNQKEDAFLQCKNIETSNSLFQAEKHFLLATLYYSKRQYETAALHAHHAIEEFKKNPEESEVYRGRLFLSHLNLGITYGEMRLRKLALHYLTLAQGYASTIEDELLIQRATACELSLQGDYVRALSVIAEIEKKSALSRSFDYGAHCLVAGGICAWNKDYERAMTYFARIKRGQSLIIRERLKSFEVFTRFILAPKEAKRLPQIPKYFSRDSECTWQWLLLKAIQSGQEKEAREFWTKLHQLRPEVYLQDFAKYPERESSHLFFQCLQKLELSSLCKVSSAELKGRLKIAFDLLSQSKIPLRKEDLIERIWSTSYSSDFDSRFYKLIERLKQKTKAPILQSNRAYYLSRA